MEKKNTLEFVKGMLSARLSLSGWKSLETEECQTYCLILNNCMNDEERNQFYANLELRYKK